MTFLASNRAAAVRCAPFALFMLLLVARGNLPADATFDARWLYGVSLLLVSGLLLRWRHEYGELHRQNAPDARQAALAVVVGLAVFALWIRLDAPWMQLGEAAASFVPLDASGQVMWAAVCVRWLGAALLVPVMEELFWRSFLMRWLQQPRFQALDPERVRLKAIMLSTFVFMLAHTLWLAAIIAGLAYAWLYVRTGRLWVPVIAHAVTNGALGVWVVATGNWQFW